MNNTQQSGSFSATNYSIAPSSSSHFPSTSNSIDPSSSTPFSSTSDSIDRPPSTSFSPSSSQHNYKTNCQKHERVSSSPPHQSFPEEHKKENYALFNNLLMPLEQLAGVLNNLQFKSFRSLVLSMIYEIESARRTTNLAEYQSIDDTERLTVSIEARLAERMNDEYRRSSPHGINQQLENAFRKMLDSIRYVVRSLHRYKAQITTNARTRTTHRSSREASSTSRRQHKDNRLRRLANRSSHKPSSSNNKRTRMTSRSSHGHSSSNNKQPRRTPRSSLHPSSSTEQKPVDIKPIVTSNQQHTRFDDDQSSEASHSSYGDEALMEVAKDAYEQRSN